MSPIILRHLIEWHRETITALAPITVVELDTIIPTRTRLFPFIFLSSIEFTTQRRKLLLQQHQRVHLLQ